MLGTSIAGSWEESSNLAFSIVDVCVGGGGGGCGLLYNHEHLARER